MSEGDLCEVCDAFEHPPCHPCPHLDGEVLPGCWSVVVNPDAHCTCVKAKPREEWMNRIERLEERVYELEAALGENTPVTPLPIGFADPPPQEET